MPRSVKDSDEDVETRAGRKTRTAIASTVPESPVRRSSRNKQSTKQNDSSPDLSVAETNNTHSFRTRAGTLDSSSLETQKRLRSSKNSVDMSENKDSERSTETQPKKMTRRSIAAMNTVETPKANTRTRRLTRAGSETKSTPTGRTTRKTRASSVDPESTTEQPIKEKLQSVVISTPMRAKRRASMLPSESTVIEEEEKHILSQNLEKTLLEADESTASVTATNMKTPNKSLESSESKSNEERKSIGKTPEEKDSSSESHDVPEEDLPDKEEESKIQSSSNTPKKLKRLSINESDVSKPEKETQDNEYDNISSVGMLFQDISADEWKQKNRNTTTESGSNSVHSTSTVKLDNDSETECDLVLVDKEAWLAAENVRTSKNEGVFDYDSDDTVVLKSKIDYLNDKINSSNEKKTDYKDSVQDSDTNSEVKGNRRKSNSSRLSTSRVQKELDEEEKEGSNKLNDKSNIDKSDANVSLHNTSRKKEKSQKNTSACNLSKNELSKSMDKQLEEEEGICLSQKEDQEVRAAVDVTNKIEVNTLETKHGRPSLDKKQKKNRSLDSSSSKKDKSKQKPKRNRLHISSSEEEEDNDESNENKRDESTKGSGKKRYNKNYSTMVHIGSDSDSLDESIGSNNSDRRNKSFRIPRFLFVRKESDEEGNEDRDESDDDSNDDKSSNKSIDSDINAEYNLDGRTIGKFSDDDIPGDECRASESESSDPDDNGSDLADFVVDDDEVEEEEDEDEDDDEGQNEEEEENQEVEKEENDDELIEDNKEQKEVTAEDAMSTEEKDNSIKMMNVSDTKGNKKKSQRQNLSSGTDRANSDDDEITKLDSSVSERKQKKKQKLNQSSEIVQETPKKNSNESEMIFAKKVKGTGASLTCSTPKANVFQQDQFKHNVSLEKNNRKSLEKVSVAEEPTDNSDAVQTTLNNSKNAKKKDFLQNNISSDLVELLKDANLPKPLLTRKAHLNKTLSPNSETPTTKYLKKQKLNDSAPYIKVGEKTSTSEKIALIDNKNNAAEEAESNTITIEKSVDLKNKESSNMEMQVGSDNEKENTENISEVNEKKKKKKKNKKNKASKELDIKNVELEIAEVDTNDDANIEIVSSTESKKSKKKNKNKESLEIEDIPNKKKKQQEEQSKKSFSVEAPKSGDFFKSKNEALEAAKQAAENIKAIRDTRKNKHKENLQPEKEIKVKRIDSITTKTSTRGIKRLPAEVLENLSDTSMRPRKKQKLLEKSAQMAMYTSAPKTGSAECDIARARKYVPSNSGGTTDFGVVNLERATKQSKKIATEKEMKAKKIESATTKTSMRGTKRFPAEVSENLSYTSMRSHKKPKLLEKSAQTVTPYTSANKNGFTECDIVRARKYIRSNCGGTTDFDVVNLQRVKKQSVKIATVASFRQKMLSRNSRYPVTSYIMYLQKQKASSRDQCFLKQF